VATEFADKRVNGLALAKIMSDSPEVADAYDALLGALRLAPPLASGNVVLVTSAEPGEGKTTVASCLANTASLAGQTVLLIDGDLRRSSLSAAVGNTDTAGFMEVLLGEAGAGEAIYPVTMASDSSQAGVISFMAAGRKSPLFLGSVDWSKARTAVRSIAQEFGIVFLDSPPILAASDALLFARIVDAVVLVVGTGNANLDRIQQAKEQLEEIGTPIAGAVLNRFEPKRHGPSNQPYRAYYRGLRT
jgi:capsular exopolysaccharide synthesis family protein